MGTLTALGLLWAVTSALAAPSADFSPIKQNGHLIVHEWGTFLSVQGSDGMTLGGMVDSDEVLPPFVESRSIASWQRSSMVEKMETPVTYFYADRPMDVRVRVEMPNGMLTHWFPAVRRYGPHPSYESIDVSARPTGQAAKSFLEWPVIHVIPDGDKQTLVSSLPKVGPEQVWRFARETDAAILKMRSWKDRKDGGSLQDEYEKFLFYRGLGTFSLPLEIRSFESKVGELSFAVRNLGPEPLRGLFAVWVNKDTIRFAPLGELAGHTNTSVAINTLFTSPVPLPEGVPQVKSAVAKELVSVGLYPKEAQAMVNTWERSYFRTEGLRVLYILPRNAVDQVIPIDIKPAPSHIERIMVGRVEVLTPDRERQVERFISELGAKDWQVREQASAGLAKLGRIGEPVLRRVAALTKDAEIRARAEMLIRKCQGG
jgi:hypothetical protein